jgi:Chitobiase/beta-hexosaminidase C-terminal domain/Beta-propeller repeat
VGTDLGLSRSLMMLWAGLELRGRAARVAEVMLPLDKAILLAVFLLIQHVCPLAIAGKIPSARSPKLTRRLSSIPMSFETNVGQSDPAVRFLSRGAGYSILFRNDEADIVLAKNRQNSGLFTQDSRHQPPEGYGSSYADVIRMRIVGASVDAELSGEGQLPGKVNYFYGRDPAQWHAGISTFARLSSRGVYRGVNLLYYSNRDRLEFDFQIAPRSSPSSIRLHFDGAKRLTLNANGNLDLVAGYGHIIFHRPLVYQLWSDNTKHLVEGSFRLFPGSEVGFAVGHYDHARPLVIDPVLDYSTYLGPASGAAAVAVDSAGEAFVAGYAAAGMPATPGSYQANFPTAGKTNLYPTGKAGAFGSAAFVAKFNSAGTELIYCTYLSGSQNDAANAIAIDAAGDAYVAGQTQSVDFPVTTSAFQTTNPTKVGAGFITELNSTGTGLIYSTYLSGTLETSINSLAVDHSGNAFVTGYTYDTDFPVTAGVFQTTSPANPIVGGKGFVSKLAAGGHNLVYSTYLGGTKSEQPNAIAIDAAGNAYVAGGTESPDFPTTPGAFQVINRATIQDTAGTGFITKLNPSGTGLVYSTFLGGGRTDVVSAIAVDATGNAYTTGFAASPDFPTTAGVFQPEISVNRQGFQGTDAFVTKLNPGGSGLAYSTFLSGSYELLNGAANDTGLGIAVDSSGDAYVVGSTADLDFPVTPGAFQTSNTAILTSDDLGSFFTMLNPAASEIAYATYLSGSGNPDSGGYDLDPVGATCDCANSIALDDAGNAYVAGDTISTDFPTTPGAFQTQWEASVWGQAAFVMKVNRAAILIPTTTTVTANVATAPYGTAIVFSATVVETASGRPAHGTISFDVGTLVYETAVLDANGKATWTSGTGGAPLPVGMSRINADFSPGLSAPEAASQGSSAIDITPLGVTASPTFSLAGGTYSAPQSVSLSDTTPGALIYYTTNGDAPVAGVSPQYVAGVPIKIQATETIQVIAAAPGYTVSPIASASYVINLPPPDFTLMAAPTTLSLSGGQPATTMISVTPLDGFTQNVSLSCSGLSTVATCSFSSATISGSGSAKLTVTLIGASAERTWPSSPFFASTVALAVFFGWIPLRRLRLKRVLWLMILVFAASSSLVGCGGSSPGVSGPSSSETTSVLTVTATSGSLTHAVTLTLFVTQP